MYNTSAICRLLNNAEEVNGTKELVHQVFLADKNYIVRKPKEPYQSNELHWFISQSRNVEDLKSFSGFTPKIWEEISEIDGTVNSNYGWCCLSKENGNQFWNAMKHLELDRNSRRAIMIYNRPTMHEDWIANRGNNNLRWQYKESEEYKKLRGDFMCCQNNHFIIRGDKLIMTVHMRSLDAVFGYNADYIWFDFIFNKALQYLKKTYPELERGDMVIYADSVHVYERHYEYLEKEATFGAKSDSLIDVHCERMKQNSGNPYLQDPENNASVLSASDKFVIRQTIAELMGYTIGSSYDKYVSNCLEKNDVIKVICDKSKDLILSNLNEKYGVNIVISSPEEKLTIGSIVGKKFMDTKKTLGSSEPKKESKEKDMVNHPDHYNQNSMEHADFVEYMGYTYTLGCATKYVFRNRFKGSQNQDLDKVVAYCELYLKTNDAGTDRLVGHKYTDIPFDKLQGLTQDERKLLDLIDELFIRRTSLGTHRLERIKKKVGQMKL